MDYFCKETNIFPNVIKIDTDGYDYDIIQSGKRSIRQNKPVIFFECQINNKSNDHDHDPLDAPYGDEDIEMKIQRSFEIQEISNPGN